MERLDISLLGRFEIRGDGHVLPGFEARRVQELLSYLLLYSSRPHPREALANLLWEDAPTAQSKKNLRQAIWLINSGLETLGTEVAGPELRCDGDWVRCELGGDTALDVAQLDRAFHRSQGIRGRDLDAETADELRRSVELYRGDLLEGCYRDWCLDERERLRSGDAWLEAREADSPGNDDGVPTLHEALDHLRHTEQLLDRLHDEVKRSICVI